MQPTIRPATPADMPSVLGLLQDAGLPTAGLEDHVGNLFVLADGSTVLGAVGFEAYHPIALLRSLVVHPCARGRGWGRRLLSFIIEEVSRQGFIGAYGLTTTIPELLRAFAFTEIRREDLPPGLFASAELRGACPSTARVFVRTIGVT